MTTLKVIFLLAAVISVPTLCFFLIRLTLKLSRSVDQVNRTLKDARPQLNMLLVNLNKAAEEINLELENVTAATGEIRDLFSGLESSLAAVEKALRSPWARWGSFLATAAAGSSLLRRILHGRG
ncbi:hypothetical protein [Candidatus Solincola sp.]|nr:hypothetical protein [Actinomycetota bacterium]MDI7251286.1 hypothetical protein [Actinomycetota bacterium]